MLQTQRYGIQVSRYTRDKQTNKQTRALKCKPSAGDMIKKKPEI